MKECAGFLIDSVNGSIDCLISTFIIIVLVELYTGLINGFQNFKAMFYAAKSIPIKLSYHPTFNLFYFITSKGNVVSMRIKLYKLQPILHS